MTSSEVGALTCGTLGLFITIAGLWFGIAYSPKPLPDATVPFFLALIGTLATSLTTIIAVCCESTVFTSPSAIVESDTAPSIFSIEELDDVLGTTLPGLSADERNLINMTLKKAVDEGISLTAQAALDVLRTAVPELPPEHLHVLSMALNYYLKEKSK
jgi:hypothetical protein